MRDYKSRDIIKTLKKNGFEIDRRKGSHIIFKRGMETISVPAGNPTVSAPLWERLKKENNIKEGD